MPYIKDMSEPIFVKLREQLAALKCGLIIDTRNPNVISKLVAGDHVLVRPIVKGGVLLAKDGETDKPLADVMDDLARRKLVPVVYVVPTLAHDGSQTDDTFREISDIARARGLGETAANKPSCLIAAGDEPIHDKMIAFDRAAGRLTHERDSFIYMAPPADIATVWNSRGELQKTARPGVRLRVEAKKNQLRLSGKEITLSAMAHIATLGGALDTTLDALLATIPARKAPAPPVEPGKRPPLMPSFKAKRGRFDFYVAVEQPS
jgi:hypothetical protein